MIDGRQKLSKAQAREICGKYYQRIRVTQKDLAALYQVSQPTIARVIAGYEHKR